MPASWVRVSPLVLIGLSKTTWRRKSGHMLMAVAAKKHLTVYYRKREAPGAGRPEVKDAFREAAAATRGILSREERNKIIRERLIAKRIGTGIYRRWSRSKYVRGYYEVKLPYTPGVKPKVPTSFRKAGTFVKLEEVKAPAK